MRRSSILFPAVLAGLGVATGAARANTQDFHLVSHSAAVDQAGQQATFTLVFDREPDFSGGTAGQAQAFQYEIDVNQGTFESPIQFDDIDAVVRGAEIFAGNGIPLRERDGDGGPDAGGWGPVRTYLPFDLQGNTLTFTTGLDDLGDDGDGHFRYRLITTQSGGLTSDVNGAVIPLPAAVWSGMIMLGGVGILAKLRARSFTTFG